MDNIKRIQVVFALDDPYQLQQYIHAYNRKNSSGYIKQLIQMDMLGQHKAPDRLRERGVEELRSSGPFTNHHTVELNDMIHKEEEESEEFDFNAGGFI